jgi:hypothetical protein
LGQRKSGLIRQVTSKKRLNSFEIFYDRTRKRWPVNTGDCLIEVTAWAGLTVIYLCLGHFSGICTLGRGWLYRFGSLHHKTFILFDFPIFWLWWVGCYRNMVAYTQLDISVLYFSSRSEIISLFTFRWILFLSFILNHIIFKFSH